MDVAAFNKIWKRMTVNKSTSTQSMLLIFLSLSYLQPYLFFNWSERGQPVCKMWMLTCWANLFYTADTLHMLVLLHDFIWSHDVLSRFRGDVLYRFTTSSVLLHIIMGQNWCKLWDWNNMKITAHVECVVLIYVYNIYQSIETLISTSSASFIKSTQNKNISEFTLIPEVVIKKTLYPITTLQYIHSYSAINDVIQSVKRWETNRAAVVLSHHQAAALLRPDTV